MSITCYNCGVQKDCDECGQEYWEEGITYTQAQFDDHPDPNHYLRCLVYNRCPECGSYRCEQ
jgi:hypothetical protein